MENIMNLYKKSLINENLQNIYLEDIYGNKATVYHRTKIENLADGIYKEGFKPGKGDTFGKGFYSTYELESQLGSEMRRRYGNIIVMFMINSLNRFMFFDYDEFLKSPTSKKIKTNKDMFIIDQMKYFGFNKFKEINENEILELQKTSKYSSEIAKYIYRNTSYIKKIIDGIFFTGSQDGKVLLSYNTDIIVPISFSQNEGENWNKVNKNMNYLKNVFSQNTDILKMNDYIIWKGGIWKIELWPNGVWEDGTWESGTWIKGTWKNGTWKNGVWMDGTWMNGTWEKGYWEGGTWLGGYDKDGNYHPKGDSPNKWKI
jgi:hypothetical protein